MTRPSPTHRWRLAAALCATLLLSACWHDDDSTAAEPPPPEPLLASAAPTLTAQPVNQAVTAGAAASFTVAATGSTLTYAWQRSTDGGTNFAAVTGAATTTLSISSTTLTDGGYRYRAQVCNTDAGRSTTCVDSSVAVLTVNVAPPPPSTTGPAAVWSPPTTPPAGSNTDLRQGPVAGIDGSDKSFALRTVFISTNTRVVASRGVVNGAWGNPVPIDTGAFGLGSYDPQLAVAANGEATAMWVSYLGSFSAGIGVNRFDGTNWGAAVQLDDGVGGAASDGRLAVDPLGRAVAVWQKATAGGGSEIKLRIHNGSVWSTAVSVDGGAGGNQPQVAVGPAGTGYVTYIGANYTIYAATINLSSGIVGTPFAVSDPANTRFKADHRLAVTALGGAILVWYQGAPVDYNLVAAIASSGTWLAPQTVATTVGYRRELAVAAGVPGEAVVTWVNNDSTALAVRVTGAGGFLTPEPVSLPGAVGVQDVQVAMNGRGRIVVAWAQRAADGTGINQQWARTFFNGGWDVPRAVQTAAVDVLVETVPRIIGSGLAISSTGSALLMWQQDVPGTFPEAVGAYLPPTD